MYYASVIALVPAYNEEDQIADTLDALLMQSVPINKILVILDNCTDRTEEIVRRYGSLVSYIHTRKNPYKKAGALNQALQECIGYKYILDTDADAILDKDFCKEALARLEDDETIGAVSIREGIKEYDDLTRKQRFLYRMVRFQRYQWDTQRMQTPDNCMVVVGPGGMLRADAVLEVGGWDNHSLTEDNALSLDLREHGWKTVLGVQCFAWSDSPLDFGELWKQRVRWSRGREDYAKRPWSMASYRGKVLYLYQWFLTFWFFFIIPFDAILYTHGKLEWWWAVLPILFIFMDRVYRLTLFPTFKIGDVFLSTILGDLLIFGWTQAATVKGRFDQLLGLERRW